MMTNFILPFAFLGLFNYGSLFEAKEACYSWAQANDTTELAFTCQEDSSTNQILGIRWNLEEPGSSSINSPKVIKRFRF